MIREELIVAICNDVSGQTRGKGFPASDREKRFKTGVGWVPTNVQITCFNTIADSIYGSLNDLIMVPDESTEVRVDFEDDHPVEHFVIGDILHLDGASWECCTRALAKKALASLEEETGLTLLSTFEQEFFYSGADCETWCGFGLSSFRGGARFGETLIAALKAANIKPDTFLAEYGPGQFEATLSPTPGIRSADECIILRELARSTATRLGERVSFSPLVTPEAVGNGVHIHFSFLDKNETPVTYDENSATGMSRLTGQFCAGVLKYMPAITSLTAPSVISYERLVPHRWSAAYNNLALRDREAGLRICPASKVGGTPIDSQFNIEYRPADAAGSPYLQIAALVSAGLQGIRQGLDQPRPTTGDLSRMSEAELKKLNIRRLPTTLEAALREMEAEPQIRSWFSENFVDIYLKHKRKEIETVNHLEPGEVFRKYLALY